MNEKKYSLQAVINMHNTYMQYVQNTKREFWAKVPSEVTEEVFDMINDQIIVKSFEEWAKENFIE